MSERPVILIGDERLRRLSVPIADPADPAFTAHRLDLLATLEAFRRRNGFGRAISAPQIGVNLRLIAMNLGSGAVSLINPEILWRSEELFTMWDDCMSFPWLMVRVRRHKSITVKYTDENGAQHEMKELDTATSELLQHEIDHLDGILATDLGIDKFSLISREVYEKQREFFDNQVDYFILPTI